MGATVMRSESPQFPYYWNIAIVPPFLSILPHSSDWAEKCQDNSNLCRFSDLQQACCFMVYLNIAKDASTF